MKKCIKLDINNKSYYTSIDNKINLLKYVVENNIKISDGYIEDNIKFLRLKEIYDIINEKTNIPDQNNIQFSELQNNNILLDKIEKNKNIKDIILYALKKDNKISLTNIIMKYGKNISASRVSWNNKLNELKEEIENKNIGKIIKEGKKYILVEK